jgi:GGDEF domain-containing protein
VVAVTATCIAAVAGVLAVRARREAQRYRAALDGFEQELGPISERIRGAVERSRSAPDAPGETGSGPKLEELIERIAADGAAVSALRQLSEEVSPQTVSRRRPALRAGGSEYEGELAREIARARRTGRPLSLLLVEVDQPTPDRVLRLAALLTRLPRVTDTVCRRRRDAFGILLPETAEDGAHRFRERLHEEVSGTFGPGRHTTFSTGIVEWQPNETGEALDARARAEVDANRAAAGRPA